jgi:hypothetical protein
MTANQRLSDTYGEQGDVVSRVGAGDLREGLQELIQGLVLVGSQKLRDAVEVALEGGAGPVGQPVGVLGAASASTMTTHMIRIPVTVPFIGFRYPC